MLNERFKEVVKESIERIESLLQSKGEEYSKNSKDRLGNFKQLGDFQGVIPEKALFNLVSKHIIALRDNINEMNNTHFGEDIVITRDLNAKYDEYIFDIIVYLILLRGLLKEKSIEDMEVRL